MTPRIATHSDLPALLELYRQLASAEPNVTLQKLERAFEDLCASRVARVYLFEDTSRLVGTYILMIVPALGDRCRPVAIVEDVVVASSARGGGIGRRMMEHAMNEARAAHCYKLMLSSNVRRTEAHAFYEALGFEKHGYSFAVAL